MPREGESKQGKKQQPANEPQKPLIDVDISGEASILLDRSDRLAAMQGRLEALLDSSVAKLCDRANDPGWNPTPAEVLGILSVTSELDSVGVRYLQMLKDLVSAKRDLEELGENVEIELNALKNRSKMQVVKRGDGEL